MFLKMPQYSLESTCDCNSINVYEFLPKIISNHTKYIKPYINLGTMYEGVGDGWEWGVEGFCEGHEIF